MLYIVSGNGERRGGVDANPLQKKRYIAQHSNLIANTGGSDLLCSTGEPGMLNREVPIFCPASSDIFESGRFIQQTPARRICQKADDFRSEIYSLPSVVQYSSKVDDLYRKRRPDGFAGKIGIGNFPSGVVQISSKVDDLYCKRRPD